LKSINQSINQSINSNQACQHSVTGKNRERSLIKPDLKPMFVNSYITERKGKRGPIKRSKARNLLERLINYEDEVLGFMTDERIPYTNNQGERDLLITIVTDQNIKEWSLVSP
jgi:transposase